MTKFDNKFVVPQVPKTFQVLELRDTQQLVKKSNLSAAARGKVINRSGSGYQSLRTTIINPSYGPANEDYLVCGCPAKGCKNEDVITWVHKSDKEKLKIDKWATIWCTGSKCSTSGHMKEWRFECPRHENDPQKTSSLTFTQALNIAFDNRTMDDDMLDELTKYLKKPENKW